LEGLYLLVEKAYAAFIYGCAVNLVIANSFIVLSFMRKLMDARNSMDENLVRFSNCFAL